MSHGSQACSALPKCKQRSARLAGFSPFMLCIGGALTVRPSKYLCVSRGGRSAGVFNSRAMAMFIQPSLAMSMPIWVPGLHLAMRLWAQVQLS